MQTLADEPLTLSLEVQTAFNIARWEELVADPQWEQWEGRIETDEFGNVIMKPLAPIFHGRAMAEISFLLQRELGGAGSIVCPISTAKGVKGTDVAWMTKDAFKKVRDEPCLAMAPRGGCRGGLVLRSARADDLLSLAGRCRWRSFQILPGVSRNHRSVKAGGGQTPDGAGLSFVELAEGIAASSPGEPLTEHRQGTPAGYVE